MQKNLRDELGKISSTGGLMDVQKVLDLARKNQSTLAFFEKGDIGLNCLGYALNISPIGEWVPDSEFVERMITKKLLREYQQGSIILYFKNPGSNGTLEHGGIVDEDCVISKWGNGHVWKHQLFDVPSQYGDHTVRYRIVDTRIVQEEFSRYANELDRNRSCFKKISC
ncbi:MAG: hypothetical protein NUV84_05650 [Candidatus Uhrbacteria bacterium]|nr:hypothetical protein [Candidatus Uhrbacteria bacterium]